MPIEKTILDFQLSNNPRNMNYILMQRNNRQCLKKWELKHFYIGKSLHDPQMATLIVQRSEIVLCDFFIYPETKNIVEGSRDIYEVKKKYAGFPKKK